MQAKAAKNEAHLLPLSIFLSPPQVHLSVVVTDITAAAGVAALTQSSSVSWRRRGAPSELLRQSGNPGYLAGLPLLVSTTEYM